MKEAEKYPTLRKPQEIEKIVTIKFLENFLWTTVSEDKILFWNAHKNEPDILFDNLWIEVGAVLRWLNQEIDIYENIFLSCINSLISWKIPSNIQIRLVFQDDKDEFLYSPLEKFEKYTCITKYISGILIYLFEKDAKISDQIAINQTSRERIWTYPNIKNLREMQMFIWELIRYVDSLTIEDYRDRQLGDNKLKIHHTLICTWKRIKNATSPVDNYFSKKTIEKLSKDKYSGNYSQKILLLHNFSVEGCNYFTSDIHFYSHYRDLIFNKIDDYITKFNSFKIYDDIFFLDFSLYSKNSNFQLVNFKNYTRSTMVDNLATTGEMRVNLTR